MMSSSISSRRSVPALLLALAGLALSGALGGCGLLITAAQVSGKMPDTASVVNAAVRAGRAVTAQQPELRTISAGEARTGALEETDERLEDGSYFDTWFYTGAGGETLQIDMWSEDFEPYLIVGFMQGGLEGSFEQLAAAGEAGAPAPATLTVTLERPGLYAIVTNSVEPASTGAYRLRVMGGSEGGGDEGVKE